MHGACMEACTEACVREECTNVQMCAEACVRNVRKHVCVWKRAECTEACVRVKACGMYGSAQKHACGRCGSVHNTSVARRKGQKQVKCCQTEGSK